MKNTYKILMVLVITTFTSCTDDFLDQPIRARQELDDFFVDEEASTRFVNGIYEKVNGESWHQINFFRAIGEMATDNMWSGNTIQPRPDITGIAHYNVFPGSTYINSFWEHNYIGITRANIALERVPEVEMDEEVKQRLLGEAKFLRGFFYFELVKNYGGVPIVTTYAELQEAEVLNRTRATEQEVWDQIEADLSDAAEALPLKSSYAAQDMGRATRGAAQAYLAKAYLFQEKWAEAQTMAENVVNSGEYQLEPDFANVWNVNNHHGPESIFEVEYITDQTFPDIGGQFTITQGSRGDQGWGWGSPTSHLEQAFLDEGDDIRLRSTIIRHGEPVFGDPDVTEFDGKPDENKSGRTSRKTYVPVAQRPDPYQRGQIPLSWLHMRYADLLLIHAEAAFFNNNTSAALASLEQVRSRVSLNTDQSLAGDALRDAIWKERRLELALEQHRLYDLRRQKINSTPRLALVMGQQGSFVRYNLDENNDPFETTNTFEEQDKGINFDINKHLLWPIPPEEIQLTQGRVVQNPGY